MTDMEARYRQRLARYTTAMRNEMPDRVPIRPFVAEWTGRYAGYTCQELAHDYPKALEAVRRCAADFDWDALVPDMVATWTGMLQAFGLRYYAIPGIDLPPDVGHQYREPPPEEAFMRPDEYDALIEDPTGYLFGVWFPRVIRPWSPDARPAPFERDLALVKGTLAMTQFFGALGEQERRLREETGTVTAIAGMLRAPLDIIADKLRGYVGLVEDLHVRPDKVRAACEALMPHLARFALATADPSRRVPIGFWMHRGCVPFVTPAQFDSVFWPTLEPIVREIWAHGHQTLFYAEGDWRRHYGAFGKLPDRSIVLHVDRADPLEAKRVLGAKFCLSGGVPNTLLARGTPEEVRSYCRKLLEGVAREGGYVMDASAILQNDARVENLRAMTQATLEYGVCPRGRSTEAGGPEPAPADRRPGGFVRRDEGARPAGTCIPWSRVRGALPPVTGDEEVCRRVWDGLDAAGYMFIWTLFLVF